MRKILNLILLIPFVGLAQKELPYYENDTIYTTCGFKIYKGEIIQLSEGNANGKLKFVRDAWDLDHYSFGGAKIYVIDIFKYTVSRLGNPYADLHVEVTFKNGHKRKGGVKVYFEKALENYASLPPEIVLPPDFKKLPSKVVSVADEIAKLNQLYKDGILTKEEFEAQKTKLLNKP